MPTFKTVKKICMEAFQLAAFSTPIFVTGQRLASKECSNGEEACPPTQTDPTSYWLFISAIIAYVAGITLLIWIPTKLFITWKKIYRPYEGLWYPGNVLFILFSYVPCVVFVLVGHEICKQQGYCFDYFRGAPIETMIIMMVVTDWSEKIRYIKLRSSDDSVRTKKYPYADYNGTKRSRSLAFSSPSTDDVIASVSRRSSVSHRSLLYSSRGSIRQKAARYLKWKDARPENLLRDLMLAYDTRLILGLSSLDSDGTTSIFQTSWIYPIYILSILSLIPLVFSPNSEFRSSVTVFLQDIPFFILRLAILSNFGSYLILQTSMLFLLKNFFATFAFFYFNVILPWRNANRKSQEYELKQVEVDNKTGNSIEHPRAVTATVASSPYAETRYGHAANGIANPGYHSRRYNDEHQRESHYSTREMDESRYDEREFSDDPADGYDDELYPTPRRMQQPEVARVERITSPQYATYHQASNIQADISRNDQNRESRKSLPPPSLPPQESPPRPRVINYDTLNDPTSFLYSENAKLEKKSTKQKLVDINFENSQDQDITAQTKVQPVVQPTSGSNQEVGSNSQLQSSMKNEVGDNDVPPSKPTVALENSTSPNTTMPVEPTYSQFDRNRKEGRRRAPPPPTSSNTRSHETPHQDKGEALPPPPAALLDESGAASASDGKSSRRQESLYTRSLARQLADEASGRRSRKEEKEVLDALDEVVQHHGKSMINSQSTTPKSTLSAQVANGVTVNDEEYDDRL